MPVRRIDGRTSPGDPAPERDRFGLVGPDHDLVHARLGDDGRFLLAAEPIEGGVCPAQGIVQAAPNDADIGDVEHPAQVREDEPRLVVDEHDAHLMVGVGEQLDGAHEAASMG